MSPLEFVATPPISPSWMFAGGFKMSAESNEMSGTDCATSGSPFRTSAANAIWRMRFMSGLLSQRRRFRRRLRFQYQLLHTPGFDFGNDDLVRIAAIHHVHDLETGHEFAGVTEFSDDRSIEFHFVNLAGGFP